MWTYETKTILKQIEKNKGKKRGKCWACDGKGYHIRIVTGNVGHIEEKCWQCDGTGIYDPDRIFPEPIIILGE